VDPGTPLPLAQQILAWLVQALGYDRDDAGAAGVSATTLKNARRGQVIRHSWTTLVREACRLLKLADPAPEVLPGFLHAWDGYVSALRSPPLDLGDRLLPMMRLLVPRLGVRLGAAMALAREVTDGPQEDWAWLCDPLAPESFRQVLRRVLTAFRPDLRTWTGRGKERGKIESVDPKTIRRWDRGDVPGPQNVRALVEEIGAPAEVPLRWARAAMVARRDMEEIVGKEAVDSWREAVRFTAMRVGTELAADTRFVPRIAELWWESLTIAPNQELAEQLAGILRLANVSVTGETVASWLHDVANRPATASRPAREDARAVLLLTVFLTHPRLIAATYEHLDPERSALLASVDVRAWLQHEWSLRWLLRRVERGEPLRLQLSGHLEWDAPTAAAARDAARRLLREGATFIRHANGCDGVLADGPVDETLAAVFGVSPDELVALWAEVEAALPYHLLNPGAERLLPEEVVRAVPKLALARARRLAEEGDVHCAVETIKAIDLSRHAPDASERADLAALLSELAHHALDEVRRFLRRALSAFQAVDSTGGAPALSPLRAVFEDAIAVTLAEPDRWIDAAERWIAAPSQGPPRVEALVLSFPYHLRRERLLGASWCPSPGGPKVGALVASLIDHAERSPSDGEVFAMLALARRLGCEGSARAPADADHRCEHLGTAPLRDRWLARIQRDLASS
jgi:hypothetical protein